MRYKMKKYSKLDNNYALRWAKRIMAINILGGQCCECGNENIFQLEFHHINRSDKDVNMSDLFTGNRGNSKRWGAIENEVKKCKLICRNCHTELHNVNAHEIKQRLFIVKGYDSCKKCGYDGVALDFHHRNKDEKKFEIGKSYSESRSYLVKKFEEIILEIDKCDILCKNCHIIEHTDTKRFDKLKEYICHKVENHKELKPRLNEEDVWRLYKQGLKQSEIAKKLDRSRPTINAIVKKLRTNNT